MSVYMQMIGTRTNTREHDMSFLSEFFNLVCICEGSNHRFETKFGFSDPSFLRISHEDSDIKSVRAGVSKEAGKNRTANVTCLQVWKINSRLS